MSKIIQQLLYKPSSDKDENHLYQNLILPPNQNDQNLNEKNRKYSKTKSDLSIKDDKKSKNELSSKNKSSNQSSNFFIIINDQENNLNKFIDKQNLVIKEIKKKFNEKNKESNDHKQSNVNSDYIEKNLLYQNVIDNLSKNDHNKNDHNKNDNNKNLYENSNVTIIENLYQNDDTIKQNNNKNLYQNDITSINTVNHLYQNGIQNLDNDNVNKNKSRNNVRSEHIYQYIEPYLSDDEYENRRQQNNYESPITPPPPPPPLPSSALPSAQIVTSPSSESPKSKRQGSFFPFSPKSIKKKTIFSESKSKKKQQDEQTPKIADQQINQLKSPTELSIKAELNNRRRRKNNQSFENVNDRIEYATKKSLNNNNLSIKINDKFTNSNKEDSEKLIKSNYKSEDNLLSTVIPLPKPKPINKSNLTNHKLKPKLRDLLEKDNHLFSENPVYKPCNLNDQNDNLNSYYVNASRKKDINELRKLKPKNMIIPDIRLTTEYETDTLVYVNLQFSEDDDNESNYEKINDLKDELNNNLNDLDNRNQSPTKLSYKERKRMLNTGLVLNDNYRQNKLKDDLSKSATDLILSAKPSLIKKSNHIKTKSNDESNSNNIQYCKVDFIKTQSLIKLRDNRIATNHHS